MKEISLTLRLAIHFVKNHLLQNISVRRDTFVKIENNQNIMLTLSLLVLCLPTATWLFSQWHFTPFGVLSSYVCLNGFSSLPSRVKMPLCNIGRLYFFRCDPYFLKKLYNMYRKISSVSRNSFALLNISSID